MSATTAYTKESIDWFETIIKQDVKINVDNPEETKETSMFGLGKKYYTYHISVKLCDDKTVVDIRHRYSTFETLRSDLANRYTPYGILVPMLPPKKPVSSMIAGVLDSSFIKERTKGLALFCQAMVANPFLRSDTKWITFIDPNNSTKSSMNSKGEVMLLRLLDSIDLKYPLYHLLSKVNETKEEVTIIERHMKSLVEKLKAVQNAERTLFSATDVFATYLFNYASADELQIRALRGQNTLYNTSIDGGMLVPVPYYDSSVVYSRGYSSYLVNANCTKIDYPNHLGIFMMTMLENELASAEGFRELFKTHEDIMFNIETAKKQDKVNKAAELEAQLNKFYKGFFYITLPLLSSLRASNIKKAVESMACCSWSLSAKLYKEALDFMKVISLNVDEVYDETCLELELLSMKTLEKSMGSPDYVPYTPPSKSIFVHLLEKLGRAPVNSSTESIDSLCDRAKTIFAKVAVKSKYNDSDNKDSEDSNIDTGNTYNRQTASNVVNCSVSEDKPTVPSAKVVYSPTVKAQSLMAALLDEEGDKQSSVWD